MGETLSSSSARRPRVGGSLLLLLLLDYSISTLVSLEDHSLGAGATAGPSNRHH